MKATVYLAVLTILAIVSGIAPEADRMTWALENLPVWIGLIWISLTYRRFPLSHLCLLILSIHAIVLMIGGHYTYSQVPIGFQMQEWFGFQRNHYDRIGHFMQGFAPAILLRELLIRSAKMPRSW
ncbi:MAG: putative membrane protein [Verrucomicrobiales bacterium]|jgi:putative membrane protein